MRILHISWEWPPVMYGGLGRHVNDLARMQVKLGHEVVVLTQHNEEHTTATDDVVDGVRVVRAQELPPEQARTLDNLLPWVRSMQSAMSHAGTQLVTHWRPDVVHAHDWVVGDASIDIAKAANLPLVVTIHATEAGRHQGWIVGDLSRAIHAAEWRLTHAAHSIIVCSGAMSTEVAKSFAPVSAPITSIPNGVDPSVWQPDFATRNATRTSWQVSDDTALIVFTGRLAWEKGVQTLIDACGQLPTDQARLVIAGRGPLEADLRERVKALGIEAAVTFAGFLSEPDLRALLTAADVAVIPSIYEPFGMVAVEAGALGTPVVAARTGGLRDIVIDGVTGLTVPAGDVPALVSALKEVIAHPMAARDRAERARERVSRVFVWPVIAGATVTAYHQAAQPDVTATSQPALDFLDQNVFTGERPTPPH